MVNHLNPAKNLETTKKRVGYIPRKQATHDTYSKLGFKSGLEIHQQLKTEKKLFCRCPSGIYQKEDDYDAEIVRHMRPTLSELGEYDGTALMEFKTRKNIFYRIKNINACTYEFDDTPPFPMNRKALDIALKIALLLKCSIVGELHITRKQYLDGSIPTGFQRTGIIGIEGKIPLTHKKVRIIQLSIEEDACREVSDIRHNRVYTTDRLGIPLIETVTYPDMKTPDEVAEAALYLRFLTRSTGKVNTGIGAAREDVNVSIRGGTRVEIKGVAHINRIPELTHIEAFRQKALVEIRSILNNRIPKTQSWSISAKEITSNMFVSPVDLIKKAEQNSCKIIAINLPQFKSILSFFTQPGRIFADEISDRLKVIACIEKPNMTHSEVLKDRFTSNDLYTLKKILKSGKNDAQFILWGPEEDIRTAIETVEERCRLAFQGVPNETRKSLKNGTTIFERVLPGPDRMYPDTDSEPIAIEEKMIENARENLPTDLSQRIKQLQAWGIPSDTHTYILKRNLFPVIKHISQDSCQDPVFIGTLLGHQLKNIEGKSTSSRHPGNLRIKELFAFVYKKGLKKEILKAMLPIMYQRPERNFESILKDIKYTKKSENEIINLIPVMKKNFRKIQNSNHNEAETLWIMGQLRPIAIGNMDLSKLRNALDECNYE